MKPESQTEGLRKYLDSLKLLLAFIAALWVVYIITLFIPLQQYGLRPRTISGLIGIFTSPFFHVGFYHLIANTLGLFTFGILFAALEKENALLLMTEIVILQGVLLWLFGRSGNHIGASGLIFGLFGYLLLVGYFHRQIKSVIASLLVLFLFGGTIFGILPTNPGVSWEGHLYGFIVGCVEARMKK